jgi:hypothetical protein
MDHNTPHIQPVTPLRVPHRLIGTLARVPHLLIAALARVPHSSQPHRDEWDNRTSDPLSFPRRKYLLALAILIATTFPAQAQWDIKESHTTASLRGIHNVGGGVAWASGTEGTVLRTEDGGYLWQGCATPPGAEKLDFRGIQAFDENTAIVMSSGKGDLSRLYKTTDGCRTWKLVFINPDKEGFWDAIQFADKGSGSKKDFGVLLGDPVNKHFVLFLTYDSGEHWERQIQQSPEIEQQGESVFAASNSSLVVNGLMERDFVTGGPGGPRILGFWVGMDDTGVPDPIKVMKGAKPVHFLSKGWSAASLPANHPNDSSAGAFSFAKQAWHEVIVGGNYQLPQQTSETAWYIDRSRPTYTTNWRRSQTPPHGYRSAVAYDPTTKTWITVGPNGTDISRDDGRNWSPLKPTPTEPQDADKNWNALSLPFVVGPKGRIGKLRDNAIPTAASSKEEKDKKD